ncbi:cytochrome P450 4C1-like [Pectinophora gossypiella]|uniref:cytochrome P450 4C1-like n=1 Tax=Pectinophora gossypiella TaxID=13191 RepID=UPI00214F5C1D|nr:cytochrome P450 4C1-like [Pectinophora gossypiella]
MWPVLVFCVFLAWWYLKIKVKTKQPPDHPGGWFGNTLYMGVLQESLWVKVERLSEECNKHGGVTRLLVGPFTYYVITDPDAILNVMNVALDKGVFYRFWDRWLGDGAVVASAEVWKPHRKLLNPMFNQHILEDYLQIFNSQARRIVELLSKEAGKGQFDPLPALALVNMETICLTFFGFKEEESILKDYSDAVHELNRITRQRFVRFWLHSYHVYRWTQLKKKEDRCLETVHGISSKLIEKRKIMLAKIKHFGKESQISETNTKKSFIDMLLERQEEKLYTEKQVREEIDTFFFGGHDSTATTLSYILVVLGTYPHVVEKVYAEVKQVLGDAEIVTKDDLPKLVYTEAVIKECMRLYPFAPFVSRMIHTDIKHKDYTLSAGSTLFFLFKGVHRHPVWGPDADQYRPERWLDPATLPEHTAAFASFSWGRRSCIGKTYAMMLMKTTVAYLVRHLTFTGDHTKLRFELDVVLKPLCGNLISVEKRL